MQSQLRYCVDRWSRILDIGETQLCRVIVYQLYPCIKNSNIDFGFM